MGAGDFGDRSEAEVVEIDIFAAGADFGLNFAERGDRARVRAFRAGAGAIDGVEDGKVFDDGDVRIERGFHPAAALKPPGGADDFGDEDGFRGVGGTKLFEEPIAERFVFRAAVRRNEIVFGEEAEFGGILRRAGFAFG